MSIVTAYDVTINYPGHGKCHFDAVVGKPLNAYRFIKGWTESLEAFEITKDMTFPDAPTLKKGSVVYLRGLDSDEPMADSDFASWQDDPGYW